MICLVGINGLEIFTTAVPEWAEPTVKRFWLNRWTTTSKVLRTNGNQEPRGEHGVDPCP